MENTPPYPTKLAHRKPLSAVLWSQAPPSELYLVLLLCLSLAGAGGSGPPVWQGPPTPVSWPLHRLNLWPALGTLSPALLGLSSSAPPPCPALPRVQLGDLLGTAWPRSAGWEVGGIAVVVVIRAHLLHQPVVRAVEGDVDTDDLEGL